MSAELDKGPARVEAIDLLRGLAMVFMALDHVRDYFTNLAFEPENLELTSLPLFLTRWVTHFCAPLFFFLAGTGAWYYGRRHTPGELSAFLAQRGLLLVLLEFTVIDFAWTFVAPWGFFGVIASLGAAMLLLALVVRLPLRVVAIGSLAIVALHDLVDTFRPAGPSLGASIWGLLHVKGGIAVGDLRMFVLFPIVPWCAVMAAGYAFGALLERPDRRKWVLRIGLAATALFVLLRATNLYGNPPALPGGVTPGDFHLQPTVAKSVILFLDTEKYPPSLQFLLMTLGPALLLLGAALDRPLPRLVRPIVVFGRVPLFFYVLHLYLIHGLAIVVALALGQPHDWLLHGAFWFNDLPAGYGHDLPVVHAVWLAVVAALYLPCRWFADLKRRRRGGWTSYL
jgi:uncharacterized membrane protein